MNKKQLREVVRSVVWKADEWGETGAGWLHYSNPDSAILLCKDLEDALVEEIYKEMKND